MTKPIAINGAALKFFEESVEVGPDCLCSFCNLPIGAAEDDPRWETHDEDVCMGCEVCETPLRLWRQDKNGNAVAEARLHLACANLLMKDVPA